MRLIVWCLLAALPGAAANKPVDFNRDIRPILSDTCFTCHGPDEATRMVNLRLDTKDGAFALRGDSAVIVPGKPAESRLYQRVTHDKKVLRMPPATSGLSLNEQQIALIKRWIEEGAKWDEHWAFVPPLRVEPPEVRHAAWSRNPIDRFLYARLQREGLKPSREAPKTTLIRRVTFDLTGLPPTPEEIDAFLKDRSPDAYEKLVDRLLASPHFGERMAMQWLDLARYADTHGFHIDSHRDMWPWRDWLIGAFNRNLPFDQFTLWQIAGDLLPEATREQLVASGFNRNHMINYEGGAIPEEYQIEYVVDRVDTTANVWMGLTMGCARCHDHKYDPISQKDFYRFAAFFNTIPEDGLDGRFGNAKPFLPLPTTEQEAEMREIEQAMASRREELDDDLIFQLVQRWQKLRFDTEPASPTRGLAAWYELDGNLSDISGHFRHGRLLKGDLAFNPGPVRRAGDFDSSTVARFPGEALDLARPFSIAFWLRVGRQQGQPLIEKLDLSGHEPVGFQVALVKPMTLPRLRRGHPLEIRLLGGAGRSLVVRSTGYDVLQATPQHLTITSDGSGKAAGIRAFLDGKPLALDVVADNLAAPLRVDVPILIGSPKAGPPFKGRIDDLRFYERVLDDAETDRLAMHYPVEVLLSTPGKRTREQTMLLTEYYLTHDAEPDLRAAWAETKSLREKRLQLEERIPTVMVMEEMEKPRDTHILARGDYQQRKEKVSPGVPALLPPLPAGEAPTRLALARWLVSPDHPLTVRVAVNRYWQMYFGHGIVKTSEDFGSQGEPPVHQQLLDWLATEFVRTGWDVKAMQRLIVTSAAYRQSSAVTPALHEKDPENRLLARGPRMRLPAEMIRDNALAVSGLLAGDIGGPSVLPYQPPGLWEELAFGEAYSAQEYVQGHGKDLYRRSMYTFWKRTAPPASMITFDAPDREKCVSRRPVTNTPLQALVTLNDPTYVEASRHLAARVLEQAPGSVDARLRHAFRLVTARWPGAAELRILRDTLRAQLAPYSKDPAAAEALLRVGESETNAAPAPALAAWTNLCSVLLNLDEAITKE